MPAHIPGVFCSWTEFSCRRGRVPGNSSHGPGWSPWRRDTSAPTRTAPPPAVPLTVAASMLMFTAEAVGLEGRGRPRVPCVQRGHERCLSHHPMATPGPCGSHTRLCTQLLDSVSSVASAKGLTVACPTAREGTSSCFFNISFVVPLHHGLFAVGMFCVLLAMSAPGEGIRLLARGLLFRLKLSRKTCRKRRRRVHARRRPAVLSSQCGNISPSDPVVVSVPIWTPGSAFLPELWLLVSLLVNYP